MNSDSTQEVLKEEGKLGTIVYRNTTVGKYSDMAGCQANFAFQILINCKSFLFILLDNNDEECVYMC